ncbi:DUF4240 domain-containing protein [Nonomuraea sp. NPDC059007]|uniref:DUF4240 domain-containing protein n=1 Tax=Nonomuraea sp. NPDC059007 TaxID=3346692 RepID=UPI00369730A8
MIEPQAPLMPTPAETARFWELLEAVWELQGPEANQARRTLAHREPTAEPFDTPDEVWALLEVVNEALDAVVSNLQEHAEVLGAEDLTTFDRVVERLLYNVDRADIHSFTDGSDDGFLYARGFILVMGKEFYEAVDAEPGKAIDDAECGEICYLFAHAHNRRFGDFPDTGSGITRETTGNQAEWPD